MDKKRLPLTVCSFSCRVANPKSGEWRCGHSSTSTASHYQALSSTFKALLRGMVAHHKLIPGIGEFVTFIIFSFKFLYTAWIPKQCMVNVILSPTLFARPYLQCGSGGQVQSGLVGSAIRCPRLPPPTAKTKDSGYQVAARLQAPGNDCWAVVEQPSPTPPIGLLMPRL